MKGKIVIIGNIEIEDEIRTGVFIEGSKAFVKSITYLFNEEVNIVPAQPENSADCRCKMCGAPIGGQHMCSLAPAIFNG
jgi:hypothetical protein